jgi:ADP-heptose:LPS heptosyltransferase
MKIWGATYGSIGDLLVGLPIFTYFEKKYTGSHKIWVVCKACEFCAPIFKNHPYINEVHVTECHSKIHHKHFGDNDIKLFDSCNVKTPLVQNKQIGWFNKIHLVDETARAAGINLDEFNSMLSKEEEIPSLYKYFDINNSLFKVKRNIGIWPFAGNDPGNRSPSIEWYKGLVEYLGKYDIDIWHFGAANEPVICELSNYHYMAKEIFFEQVKMALGTECCLTTDGGSVWLMTAYRHKTIALCTSWKGQSETWNPFVPRTETTKILFNESGINRITYEQVLGEING